MSVGFYSASGYADRQLPLRQAVLLAVLGTAIGAIAASAVILSLIEAPGVNSDVASASLLAAPAVSSAATANEKQPSSIAAAMPAIDAGGAGAVHTVATTDTEAPGESSARGEAKCCRERHAAARPYRWHSFANFRSPFRSSIATER